MVSEKERNTPASLVYATVAAGAAAEYHALGFPWSTIAVRASIPAPREGLRDYEHAIHARIGS